MKKTLIICLLATALSGAQHSISGSFSPSENYRFAFLYKANTSGASYVDQARLDAEGRFSIALDTSQTAGIYKIVYALPAEEHNFDLIYNAREDIEFEFNEDSGISFTESNENKLWASYLKSMGMVNQTISNYYKTDGKDRQAFQDIFNTLKETQSAYENSARGMLVLDLIKANHPYIPNDYEDVSSYSNNLKRTYFDHIDFDNAFLQSSSFITDRINAYLFDLTDASSNSDYRSRIDDIANALDKSALNTRLGLMHLLWEEFVQLNNDDLSNYIADTYLLDLAKASGQSQLLERLEAQKRISVGNKAPDFKIATQASPTTLYELAEDSSYLLIFWSSGCSHCLKEVPVIHELVKDRKDLKVIAYGLEADPVQWEATIKDLPDFMHVYGPKKWDNPIVALYSLSATPTYFLLNGEKEILAKPYDLEAVKQALKDL
jgi:thiol-disulfide isomerase/thioredoxin